MRIFLYIILCLSLAVNCFALEKKFAIIATSDIHGNFASHEEVVDGKKISVGGIDKLAWFIEQEKLKCDGVLVVSGGDNVKNINEVRAMNFTGYDVATLGNHEFDFGLKNLGYEFKKATYDCVNSNIIFKDDLLKKIIKPYVIKDKAGLKIGVFGLLTPELSKVSNVGNDIILEKNIVKIAQNMVDILKSQKVDIIIALTHIGLPLDRVLAKEVKGIDIIFGGHTHACVYEKNKNGTIIIHTGSDGKYFGLLNFDFENKIIVKNFDLKFIAEINGSNLKVKNFVERYNKLLQIKTKQYIGVSSVDLDARSEVVRKKESNLGNAITDAWLDWFSKEKDICAAIVNSGAIRGNRIYPKGDLFLKDIMTIDPFGNSVVKIVIDGKSLLQVLEMSAGSINGSSEGGFLQVSGIKMEIDLKSKSGFRVKKAKIFYKGSWENIQKNKKYKILINSWLANGGDGYSIFKQIKDKEDTGLAARDLFVAYIKKYKIINPVIEERIIIRS